MMSCSSLSTLGSSFVFSWVEIAIFLFLQSIHSEKRHKGWIWLDTHQPLVLDIHKDRFKDAVQHITFVLLGCVGPLLPQAFQSLACLLASGISGVCSASSWACTSAFLRRASPSPMSPSSIKRNLSRSRQSSGKASRDTNWATWASIASAGANSPPAGKPALWLLLEIDRQGKEKGPSATSLQGLLHLCGGEWVDGWDRTAKGRLLLGGYPASPRCH